MASSDIFAQVRSAVNIVDVIGEHVALKRAGREFKGLCPFHDDHRPSMAVVPHKQIFHCFVCGMGGDVFKFVREFHKMSNGEALRTLAQRAGIRLPELPPRGGRGPDRDRDGLSPRELIANTNEWACGFFEKCLRSPLGKAGLDYLHGRGLSDETITRFRLGFAPDSWTGMVNSALRAGVPNEHLLEAGLIKQRADSSPYDAFRNRVIFPIIDATGGSSPGGRTGRVIAFGGRVLEEKRDEAGNVVEAKYLNSPDSRLFNKSEALYGIHLARQAIIKTRCAIVVEGYMDVIACHQAGVTNVIATLGTALTADHARILKNYAQTIVLVFDSDDAGRRAADRALEVFVRGSLDIKLTGVPDGKDPCDYCMRNGGEPFQALVHGATDALTYKWRQLLTQFHSTDSLSARQEAVTTYLRFVAAALEGNPDEGAPPPVIDPVRRGLLLAKISSLVNLPLAELQQTIRMQARTLAPRAVAAPQQPAAEAPAGEQGSEADTQGWQTRGRERSTGLAAAESWLLGALLVRPALYDSLRNDLSLHLFQKYKPLATVLLEYFDNHADLSHCTLAELTGEIEELSRHSGHGGELTAQALQFEARVSDWLEPTHLSPQHTKLLQHLSADRGLSLESLAADALKELQSARAIDPALEHYQGPAQPPASDAPPDPAGVPDNTDAESAALRELQSLIANKSRNPNLRNTNFPV